MILFRSNNKLRIFVLLTGIVWVVAAVLKADDTVARLQAELPERKFPALEEILQKALANGPSIIMSEWDAAVAHERSRLYGRAPMLPSLNANVNAGATKEDRSDTSAGPGYSRDYTAVLYSVNFYQPVFHWGALSKSYQIWQLRQAMSERNIAETRRILAIDIRRRYFDIIIAANALKLARENMKRLETDKKNTEQQIADGALAPAHLDGANRAIDLARPELEQAENQYAALRQSLAQLAGVPESALDGFPEEVPVAQNITDALNAIAGSTTTRPSAQLDNLYDEIGITKLDYQVNKVRQLPKFGLSASVVQSPDTGYNPSATGRALITSWNASLSMQWNLFDGLATQAAKRASLNQLRKLETQRAQAEQQESAERRNEVAKLRVQWERLQNAESDLARARGGYELTEQDFAAGMVSSRNVEDARMSYRNALQGIYATRAEFYTSLATCLSNRGQDPAVQAAR